MTNLLRKFKDLIFESDENEGESTGDQAQARGSSASSGEDVLAAIEKIRRDLEQEGHTDFDEPEDVLDPGLLAARKKTDKTAPAAGGLKINIGEPPPEKPSAEVSKSSAPITDGSGSINVPKLLSIPEVYARAQIEDGPGQVDKINLMLNDPEMEGLAMDIRARSVKMALKASGIGIESILADAGRRDQALEDYSFYLEKKLEQINRHVNEDNQRLQQEIDSFVAQKQELMERNRRSLSEASRIRDEFKAAKQAEEQRLYDLVTPFVSPGENPVELN